MNGYKSLSARPGIILLGIILFLPSCGGNNNSITDQSVVDLSVTDHPDEGAFPAADNILSDQDGPPPTQQRINIADISDAIPQNELHSRYGNPSSYEVLGKRYYPLNSSKGYKERGIASWYGSKFHGKRTSSGEPYNMHGMTAAHKTLPLPTYVKVTNLRNDRQVILKVNDRGPFHENRIIDLSHTAASKLEIIGHGTGLVEVEAIDPDNWDQDTKSVKQSQPNQQQKSMSPAKLYVQVGAFISFQNARKLQLTVNNKLQQHASISETQKSGHKFYRVRIGPLASAEQADTLTYQLSQQGFATPRIVIE
jgi:rare lipoprotein A